MNKTLKILSIIVLCFCSVTVHSEIQKNNPEAEIRISTMGGKTKYATNNLKRLIDIYPKQP